MKTKQPHDIFLSEDDFVGFLKIIVPSYGGIVGIGDDAAVVSVGTKRIVFTTDSLVENVHFKREWVTPLYLGKKSGARESERCCSHGRNTDPCLGFAGIAASVVS